MASLDTRGLASGFAQGFGLVNQYQQQKRQNEHADRRMDMEEQRFGLQMETAEMKKEQAQRTQDAEDLKFTFGKIASGMEVDESEIDLLKKYPKYWAALDPDTDFSISKAMNVIDPDMPDDLNDPEALASLNQMFGAEINKGGGGQKRIIGAVPSPDGQGLSFELEVIGEDGKSYNAPMTGGRGTEAEGDDWVKSVDLGEAIDQVQGMRMMRMAFQTPEAQQNASRMLSVLRGGDSSETWELEEHPRLGAIQRNIQTGEIKPVRAGAGSPLDRSGSGGSGGSREYAPSSDVKTIEYFKQQGYSHEEAVRMTMELKGRGEDNYGRGQDQLGYLQGRVTELEKVRDGREWQGMSEQQRQEVTSQIEQLRTQRDQVAGQLYGNGGGQRPSPQGREYPQEGDMVGNPEPSQPAPRAAVEYLRSNDTPELREQFQAKYGYLPEGF